MASRPKEKVEGKRGLAPLCTLHAIDAERCHDRRIAYLARLPFFQELYVEWLVDEASMYLIEVGGRVAGHAGIDRDNRLVEFHLDDEYLPRQDEVFGFLLASRQIGTAIVKSFDHLFLSCCQRWGGTFEPIGCLFRDRFVDQTVDLEEGFVVRQAGLADYPLLVAQQSGLYESERELRRMLDHRQITLFLKDDALVGCGFRITIHAAFDYVDVGMWVHPAQRGQGYAKQIIGHLKRRCLADGQIPICGCAIDNVASRKALEANGYTAAHRLLEYRFATT